MAATRTCRHAAGLRASCIRAVLHLGSLARLVRVHPRRITMIPLPKTLLAAVCSLALAGAASAVEPEDPKTEPAETHHGGGDAMKHDRTAHPVEGSGHRHGPGDGDHGMHRGKGGMGCQPDTGDADADFALRMRRLHER